MKTFMLAVLAVGVLVPLTVQAIPINITVDSSGDLFNVAGVANITEYGETIATDNLPVSNDSDDNLDFLIAMISNWNGVLLSPVLPSSSSLSLDVAISGSPSSYTVLPDYEYVVIHFGAGKAGGRQVSQGGWWSAYYLGGEGLSLSALPQVGGDNVGGFSSARYFGTTSSVPDGGMTLGLLGLALVGLDALRRKFRA